MSKKYGTKKGKEKKIPERELIGGEFYLIRNACMHLPRMTVSITMQRERDFSQDRIPGQQMITLHGLVLQ